MKAEEGGPDVVVDTGAAAGVGLDKVLASVYVIPGREGLTTLARVG